MGLSSERKAYLDELCNKFRIDVIKHCTAYKRVIRVRSLSVCEITSNTLFWKTTIDPKTPKWEDRDRIKISQKAMRPNKVMAEYWQKRVSFPVEEMALERS